MAEMMVCWPPGPPGEGGAVLGVTSEEKHIAFPFRFRELIKLFYLSTKQTVFFFSLFCFSSHRIFIRFPESRQKEENYPHF